MHVRADRFALTARLPHRLIAVAFERAARDNVDCRHRVKMYRADSYLGEKIIQLLSPLSSLQKFFATTETTFFIYRNTISI